MINKILLLPNIRIQNANALTSPLTIGFPAMTAFMGAMHALQRKLNFEGLLVQFEAVGVVAHDFNLHTHKGFGDYDSSIIGTANPLDKNGARPPFIEDARCHIEVSMVISCGKLEKSDEKKLIDRVGCFLNSQLKIAGGDILDIHGKIEVYRDFNILKRKLMPGYALIERRELVIEAMEEGQDPMDAIIDYLSVHYHCENDINNHGAVTWTGGKKPSGEDGYCGWIVPVATGFQGLSALGAAKNQRNNDVLHRFAESLITLGEFKLVYQLENINELLWHYKYEEEGDLYICTQNIKNSNEIMFCDGF